jgi:hypothetical protein
MHVWLRVSLWQDHRLPKGTKGPFYLVQINEWLVQGHIHFNHKVSKEVSEGWCSDLVFKFCHRHVQHIDIKHGGLQWWLIHWGSPKK